MVRRRTVASDGPGRGSHRELAKISTALSEIVVGTVAQFAIGALAGREALGAKAPWITFLAGTGAIVLTFLAGSELDPNVSDPN